MINAHDSISDRVAFVLYCGCKPRFIHLIQHELDKLCLLLRATNACSKLSSDGIPRCFRSKTQQFRSEERLLAEHGSRMEPTSCGRRLSMVGECTQRSETRNMNTCKRFGWMGICDFDARTSSDGRGLHIIVRL